MRANIYIIFFKLRPNLYWSFWWHGLCSICFGRAIPQWRGQVEHRLGRKLGHYQALGTLGGVQRIHRLPGSLHLVPFVQILRTICTAGDSEYPITYPAYFRIIRDDLRLPRANRGSLWAAASFEADLNLYVLEVRHSLLFQHRRLRCSQNYPATIQCCRRQMEASANTGLWC